MDPLVHVDGAFLGDDLSQNLLVTLLWTFSSWSHILKYIPQHWISTLNQLNISIISTLYFLSILDALNRHVHVKFLNSKSHSTNKFSMLVHRTSSIFKVKTIEVYSAYLTINLIVKVDQHTLCSLDFEKRWNENYIHDHLSRGSM